MSDWLCDWLIDWPFVRLIAFSIGWLFAFLIVRLIDCLDRSVDWLIDWLKAVFPWYFLCESLFGSKFCWRFLIGSCREYIKFPKGKQAEISQPWRHGRPRGSAHLFPGPPGKSTFSGPACGNSEGISQTTSGQGILRGVYPALSRLLPAVPPYFDHAEHPTPGGILSRYRVFPSLCRELSVEHRSEEPAFSPSRWPFICVGKWNCSTPPRLCNGSIDRLIRCWVSIVRSIDWLGVECSIVWSIDWLFDWLFERLIGRLIDWSFNLFSQISAPATQLIQHLIEQAHSRHTYQNLLELQKGQFKDASGLEDQLVAVMMRGLAGGGVEEDSEDNLFSHWLHISSQFVAMGISGYIVLRSVIHKVCVELENIPGDQALVGRNFFIWSIYQFIAVMPAERTAEFTGILSESLSFSWLKSLTKQLHEK